MRRLMFLLIAAVVLSLSVQGGVVRLAILSDVQIEATNEEESTYSIQLTGKKNALTDIRALMSADEYYLVSANGSKLFAAHEPNE